MFPHIVMPSYWGTAWALCYKAVSPDDSRTWCIADKD